MFEREVWPRRVTFKRGAGPLLRTCTEGERQMSKRGPLECGVVEFGGSALGGGVEAGLGLCMAGGRLRGHRIRPGSPIGFPEPKWTGKALAAFSSVPFHPSHTVSPRVSLGAAGPLTMDGSHCV